MTKANWSNFATVTSTTYPYTTSGYIQTGDYMSNFERAYKVALKLVDENLVKADDLKTFNKLVALIEKALSGKND